MPRNGTGREGREGQIAMIGVLRSRAGRVVMALYGVGVLAVNLMFLMSLLAALDELEVGFPVSDTLQLLGVFAIFSF